MNGWSIRWREGEGYRIAYDGKDIELMTIGPRHESRKSLLDMFIAIVASELRIDRRPMGSTTWKRKLVGRGIESDLSYYFDPIKLAAYEAADARQSDNIDDYPNPDLAAEIDISPPVVDRSDIYAKLRGPGDLAPRRDWCRSSSLTPPAGTSRRPGANSCT